MGDRPHLTKVCCKKREGDRLALNDTLRALLPTRVQRRHARQHDATPHDHADDVGDVIVEMSSIDMTVKFFEDRLLFRRRLGSKHGVIHYRDVRTLRLRRRASRQFGVTKGSTGTSLALTKKMTFRVKGERRLVTFDFHDEPLDRVKDAFSVVQRGMPRAPTPSDDEGVVS